MMKASLFVLSSALILGAGALAPRLSICCFRLAVAGDVSGSVGQLDDQNGVGGTDSPDFYCINEGAITDGTGRSCFFNPATSQFLCEPGAQRVPGFSIGCDGAFSFNGITQYWACATGEPNFYNITSQSVQSDCRQITLVADACRPACESPSPNPSPTPSQSSSLPVIPLASSLSPPPPPPPAVMPSLEKRCPAGLTGPFEFPHLIVPINLSSPDQAYGTSYNGQITTTISTIYNFDIPPSDAGKTCSLVFLFPGDPSRYTFAGNGAIEFARLVAPADMGTTFNNAPDVQTSYGVTTLAPGNAYTITTFDCPANQRIAYRLTSAGETNLVYFQDYNQPAIGLYITKC